MFALISLLIANKHSTFSLNLTGWTFEQINHFTKLELKYNYTVPKCNM